MAIRHPLGLKFQPPAAQMDPETAQALTHCVNRMTRTGEITRALMDEMSVNYVTATQLSSQAMTVAHYLASQSVQTEESRGFLKELTRRYLGRMVTVVELVMKF